MLDKFRTRRRDHHFSSEASSMAVGLGILVSHVHGYENVPNTVLVSAALSSRLRLKKQQPLNILTSPPHQSCYLKACFLCKKNLSPDEDIYMYRGDQGFCSVECRNRQIILDETKELELSTKRMVAAYRRCSGVSETGVRLDELRRRDQHIPARKVRAIFS